LLSCACGARATLPDMIAILFTMGAAAVFAAMLWAGRHQH
jgi:hypothetical protein